LELLSKIPTIGICNLTASLIKAELELVSKINKISGFKTKFKLLDLLKE
jgi:hypothetical protein